MDTRLEQSKALAAYARLSILAWLQDPDRHFPDQSTGKPSDIGVCVTLIAAKLSMAQPTASRHLDVLRRAGFLKINKVGAWSFFSRDEAGLNAYKAWVRDDL